MLHVGATIAVALSVTTSSSQDSSPLCSSSRHSSSESSSLSSRVGRPGAAVHDLVMLAASLECAAAGRRWIAGLRAAHALHRPAADRFSRVQTLHVHTSRAALYSSPPRSTRCGGSELAAAAMKRSARSERCDKIGWRHDGHSRFMESEILMQRSQKWCPHIVVVGATMHSKQIGQRKACAVSWAVDRVPIIRGVGTW